MVRPVKDAEQPALAVVVSETATGLRLLLRAVPVTKNADEDVAALLTAAKDGIKRHGEAVKEIVAVPPFVSNDLEFTHEHLKGAFAKLAEAEAFDRRGVLVVELEEAEALAREVALAAPGTTLARPLPVYLLGEYRHEGRGKDATVSVKLRAERGGKPVSKPEALVVKPEESPAAVRKWSAGVLDALAKDDRPRPPADPKTEAGQLAERARLFKRLGNWKECVTLAEAALLLDPTQLALHIDVMTATGPVIRRARDDAWLRKDLKAGELYVRLYRRGLEHLEAFVVGGGDLTRHRTVTGLSIVNEYRTSGGYLRIEPRFAPEFAAMIRELQVFERELFLRLLPRVGKLPVGEHMSCVHGILHTLPARERFAMLVKLVGELPDAPESETVARWYATVAFSYTGAEASPEGYQDFRTRMAAGKTKPTSAAAEELRKLEAKKAAGSTAAKVPAPEADRVRLAPGALTTDSETVPARADPLRLIHGLVPAGPSVDVVTTNDGLYLMAEKGKLRPVTKVAPWFGPGSAIRYDGRYVWVSCNGQRRAASLAVIDPTTGRVWDLTRAEGLPQPTPEFLKGRVITDAHVIAPLGAGRACVAGFLGRAWVAVVTFDPAKGTATAKVIHEARDAVDRLDQNQWTEAGVSFVPGYAHTLTGVGSDGKSQTRVLVGRSETGVTKVNTHALVIDPEGGRAEVLRDRPVGSFSQRGAGPGLCVGANGSVYFPEFSLNPTTRLGQVKLPGPTVERIVQQVPKGTRVILPVEGRWHLLERFTVTETGASGESGHRVGTRWWVVDPGETRPRLVGSDLPEIESVAVSSHYGLVALVQSAKPQPTITLHTVEVAPPKK